MKEETLIRIYLITAGILLAVFMGYFIYSKSKPASLSVTSLPLEQQLPPDPLKEAEKTISGFLEAQKKRDLNKAKEYLTPELSLNFDTLEFVVSGSQQISRFELIGSNSYVDSCLIKAKVYYENTERKFVSQRNGYYITCIPDSNQFLIEGVAYKPPKNTVSLLRVNVYFASPSSNGGYSPTPVARYIPGTKEKIRATLEVLLQGPSLEELDEGYASALPFGSKLKSFTLVNGVARVDFTNRIQRGGGSTNMAFRKEQITRTLMQFPEIKKVTISVEGESDEGYIFQP